MLPQFALIPPSLFLVYVDCSPCGVVLVTHHTPVRLPKEPVNGPKQEGGVALASRGAVPPAAGTLLGPGHLEGARTHPQGLRASHVNFQQPY